MSELITEYADYDSFAREWHANDLDKYEVTLRKARERGLLNEQDTRQMWQLLGLLPEENLFIHLPKWLAEEKVGVTERVASATFVGRITRETEKAILFEDSAATHGLMRLAHGIHSLESGIENTGADDDRREELERRLEEKTRRFENRDGVLSLSDEWLPKSQIISAIRRRE